MADDSERKFYNVKQFDLGWIFYDDKNKSQNGDNGYWEIVRQIGVKDANASFDSLVTNFTGAELRVKMGEYARSLMNMSMAERAREERLLKEYSGMDYSSETGRDFIRHFSEIIVGQERFEGTINRLIAGIEAGGKNRAPSQAVNFVSYFKSAFNKVLEEYSPETLVDDKQWDTIVKKATDLAIDNMLVNFDPTKAIFGTHKDYEGLDQYLKSNPIFYQFIRTYLKIDSLKSEVEKFVSGEKRKRGEKIKINDVYKISTKGINNKDIFKNNEGFDRMLGGFIHEFLEAGAMQITLTDAGANVVSNSLKSNVGATDTITIASKKVEISFLEDVEEQIQKAAYGNSQQDIAQHFKELNRKLTRKKYSDLFIIHGSDKLYSMGDSFRGFTKDQKITDIQYLLDQSELGGRRFGHELVSLYLNTTPGAALSDDNHKNTIRDSLRVIVAAVAGHLLFSDWSMIGQESTGATQIHIFDLDGVIIPLSYVLEGMSLAMTRFGEEGIYRGPMTIGSFTTPKEILYPANKSDRYGYGDPKNDATDFNKFWNEQRDDARSKSKFTITFQQNFKEIVREIAATF